MPIDPTLDHAQHSQFSDPGPWASLLAAVPPDIPALSAVVRNTIVHYRTPDLALPQHTRDDIHLRWVSRQLAADQARHASPLDQPRQPATRLQGCCRDHTLLTVSILRSHGIPARSRVGFAGYFDPVWSYDHVIVEAWLDHRWRRFDPEVDKPVGEVPDPTDMAWGRPGGRGFSSASAAWLALRDGTLDAETCGVSPDDQVLRGPVFLFNEVIHEMAHRHGLELLLWDGWGRMAPYDVPITDTDAGWLDEIARLSVAADAGDRDAELALASRFARDPGLNPGRSVMRFSPHGEEPVEVSIEDGTQP